VEAQSLFCFTGDAGADRQARVADVNLPEQAEGVLDNAVDPFLFRPQEQEQAIAVREHRQAQDPEGEPVIVDAAGLLNDDRRAANGALQHFLDVEDVVRRRPAPMLFRSRGPDHAEDDERRPVVLFGLVALALLTRPCLAGRPPRA